MTRIDPAALAEKLAGNSLARRIIVLEETPSTNLAAKALAAEDAPSGTLVLANRQTAGRGRRGRAWQSEAGAAVCMSLLLRRSPSAEHLSPAGQAKMKKIVGCLHCNQCKAKCPYGLDTPALLARNYEDYKRVLAGEVKV